MSFNVNQVPIMNDFERAARQAEGWRRYEQALDDACEEPDMLHCPVCMHEYMPESEERWTHYCLRCAIVLGVGVKMGMVEDFDEPPWYERYLRRPQVHPMWQADIFPTDPESAEDEL